MRLNLIITQQELEELIADHVNSKLPAGTVDKVELFVKSKQNYRGQLGNTASLLSSMKKPARSTMLSSLRLMPKSNKRRHYQRYRSG
jgi:hypothetical protein